MAQIFFVSGAQKSGTTWLQRLLDAHPDVVCSGEGHFVEELVGPLLKLREAYNAKQALVGERVYEGEPYYPPMSRGEIGKVARELILGRMSSRQPGAQAVGDKTPRYTQHQHILAELFPEARFLNMVRHPYDVAVSRLHHGLRAGVEQALQAGHPAHQTLVRNAAEAWIGAQAKVAAFRAKTKPERFLQLRYEDLLAAPEAEAARAFRFLGVSDAAGTVAAAVAASAFEALSGRRPGEEDPRSFFRKGVAGDWRGKLDAADLQTIDALCGDQMRAEGYQSAADEVGG